MLQSTWAGSLNQWLSGMASSSASSAMSARACKHRPPLFAEMAILTLQLASQMSCLWSHCRTSSLHCMPSLQVAGLTKALSMWCLLPADVFRWHAVALPDVVKVVIVAWIYRHLT